MAEKEITMKHIFIDFEMHPVAREFKAERAVCGREIIEFGAVMLDEKFSEISAFKRFVKPKYVNCVYAKIAELTGITYSMLVGADTFSRVLNDFVEWCYSFDEDITVYAWSNSDLVQLRQEMELKGIVVNEKIQRVLDNWVDFQKDYCEIVQSDKLLSLERALSSTGEYFVGDMHDALYDARNTAALFVATRDREEFLKQIKPIEEVLDNTNKESVAFSLGDIFNFNAYQFATV